jgi:FtsP/CotA-like multicopper oxidase with cupredoxin domain
MSTQYGSINTALDEPLLHKPASRLGRARKLAAAVGVVVMVSAALAHAARGGSLRVEPSSASVLPDANPSRYASHDGLLRVTLTLDTFVYSDPSGLSFVTRAYNSQIPAPTLVVYPGDRLVVTLKNNLESEARVAPPGTRQRRLGVDCSTKPCISKADAHYKDPNTTNLHTHGLHTSPNAPGDDVLDIKIGPGESYEYTINIPEDHMPGSFHYHPHWMGSTALQAGGGAAGFLIVGTPPSALDGYPAWLQDITGGERDRQLMLQTVPLSTLDGIDSYSSPAGGRLFEVLDSSTLPSNWSQITMDNNQAEREGWDNGDGGGRRVDNIPIVNGRVRPTLQQVSGEWVRWRILHAGPFLFMDVTLEPMTPAGKHAAAPPVCEMQLLASDGIYLSRVPRPTRRAVLPPAGRADVAVRCVGAGAMRLASGARPGASGAFNENMYWHPHMATLHVTPASAASARSVRRSALSARASDSELLPVFEVPRPAYLTDLVQRQDEDVRGRFRMAFAGATVVDGDGSASASGASEGANASDSAATGASVRDATPSFPMNGDDSTTCRINGLSFEPGAPLGTWRVNELQEWSVSGLNAHPLHLHVNPFQLTEVGGGGGGACDAEYGYTCVGDWRDTLMLPVVGAAKFRFVTATFTGNEVLHCHYATHEDLGCLTYFRIVDHAVA